MTHPTDDRDVFVSISEYEGVEVKAPRIGVVFNSSRAISIKHQTDSEVIRAARFNRRAMRREHDR